MTTDRGASTNWSYWRAPLDAAAETFGPFAGLATLWRSRRPPELARRSDFAFEDFRGWWGRIAIARFDADPFDVRFVLWGTVLTRWWGVDYTGKRLGEASADPDAWLRTEGVYFRAMAADPFIGVASGDLEQHGRRHVRVLGLDLPLGGDDGVSHVLTAHVELPHRQTPMSVLKDCPMRPFDPGAVRD
jgi:hypothetical protein